MQYTYSYMLISLYTANKYNAICVIHIPLCIECSTYMRSSTSYSYDYVNELNKSEQREEKIDWNESVIIIIHKLRLFDKLYFAGFPKNIYTTA